MRQLGIICLCSLLLETTALAASEAEIVEYSMYDEFGDIMFNAPGQLVRDPGKTTFDLEDALRSDQDISRYRYRSDAADDSFSRTQNQQSEALTTYSKNRYNTNQVWKFRPLEDEKEKTIIKIEDEPAPASVPAPAPVPAPVPMQSPVVAPAASPATSLMQQPTYSTQSYSAYPGYQYQYNPYQSYTYGAYQPYSYGAYPSYQYPYSYSYPYQGYGYGTGMPMMPMAPMMPGLMVPFMPF